MTRELLQQVRVLDPVSGTDEIADILMADNKIEAIATNLSDLPTDTEIRDSRGLVLGTGLVDLYSHSGEPGFEERETLESLQLAATAGGFTRLAILPDTTPAIDNPGSLAQLQRSGFYFWGALTLGVQGQQMTELAELAAAGVVGFADGKPISNLALLRRMLEYLQPLGKPVALVAQNPQLAGNGVVREGRQSLEYGLPGVNAIAETTALAAILELVAEIGTPVHIMNVSTARSVELIAEAKGRLPITASTSWMHLLLDTTALGSYDPSLRTEPPLGNPTDRAALKQGVRDGVIDAIAIAHSPYTYEEKTVAFEFAPPGAIGLELALPLLWEALVEGEGWQGLELWRSLSVNPARCLGQKLNAIAEGGGVPIAPHNPTELVLFDPQQTWTVERATLKSRSSNTPWLGKQIKGRVVKTVRSEWTL